MTRLLPERLLSPLAATVGWESYAPAVGRVRFGSLRRTAPISRHWGWDRGLPVDRWYIERFLDSHRSDIQGRVLEAGDDSYTRRFGDSRVHTADILYPDASNPAATVIGDLNHGEGLPGEAFDCILLVETLQMIFDTRSAMRTLHRMLRPGGVLLLTAPGITPTGDATWHESWHWMFTPVSLRRIAGEWFDADSLELSSFGNVLSATAFLYGVAADELSTRELTHVDPAYPVTITLRTRKRGDA